MTDSNTTQWNGIPDDPQTSGWHWIGYSKHIEPHYWSSDRQAWTGGNADDVPFSVLLGEYLGPCTPPISRCRDGSRKVAVNAQRTFDCDEIAITMNDGSTHYIDSYYWHNGAPVFEIVGKTIPEINETAAACRSPSKEETT